MDLHHRPIVTRHGTVEAGEGGLGEIAGLVSSAGSRVFGRMAGPEA